MKILLQRLWEIKMDWDDPTMSWKYGRNGELPILAKIRCYTPKGVSISSLLFSYTDLAMPRRKLMLEWCIYA